MKKWKHPFEVSSVPKDKPESWPEEYKTVVMTDWKNYTYENLNEVFDELENQDFKNITDRFKKWQAEREVLEDPGIPGLGLNFSFNLKFSFMTLTF